jgi:hypothetical protein
MYITAEFSGYYGWWNERLASHRGFVGALRTVTLASLAAMQAILEVRPDALFIHAESSEHTHANHPDLAAEAEMFNERRFLTLDLICGHRISAGMYAYLRENGMSEAEYARLRSVDLTEHFIIGHDYYITNEHLLVAPEIRHGAGEIFGYYAVARAYHERYGLPIMHTETNLAQGPRGDEASKWLWKTWANIQQLRREGVPICGMTWYSVTDQIDWDVGLRWKNDRVNPLGLYDLDRRLRPAGEAFGSSSSSGVRRRCCRMVRSPSWEGSTADLEPRPSDRTARGRVTRSVAAQVERSRSRHARRSRPWTLNGAPAQLVRAAARRAPGQGSPDVAVAPRPTDEAALHGRAPVWHAPVRRIAHAEPPAAHGPPAGHRLGFLVRRRVRVRRRAPQALEVPRPPEPSAADRAGPACARHHRLPRDGPPDALARGRLAGLAASPDGARPGRSGGAPARRARRERGFLLRVADRSSVPVGLAYRSLDPEEVRAAQGILRPRVRGRRGAVLVH